MEVAGFRGWLQMQLSIVEETAAEAATTKTETLNGVLIRDAGGCRG